MESTYVLVTAARNEEEYIERTIESIVAQTCLPKKWVIVSDGSTDRTDEIVTKYATEHDFIELLRLEDAEERNFASQVYGQHAGAERLKDMDYDFIGMLDADITVDPDYYERILKRFEQNPKLGLAGGALLDLWNGEWVPQKITPSLNVSGPVQMFRKQIFKDINGYIPLRKGGQDAVAEVMVRMHGWQVASFNDIKVMHYRPTGTEGKSITRAKFACGNAEYLLGYHPLFIIAKCLSRIPEPPFLLGSLSRLCGYCWPWLRRDRRTVSPQFVKFLRQEQMQRIWSQFLSRNHEDGNGEHIHPSPMTEQGSS